MEASSVVIVNVECLVSLLPQQQLTLPLSHAVSAVRRVLFAVYSVADVHSATSLVVIPSTVYIM